MGSLVNLPVIKADTLCSTSSQMTTFMSALIVHLSILMYFISLDENVVLAKFYVFEPERHLTHYDLKRSILVKTWN